MKYIQRRTVTITLPSLDMNGQHIQASVDTATKLYEIIITPTSKEGLTSTDEAVIQDVIKKLDPEYTGEVTEVKENDYVELSEPEYAFFVKQVNSGSLWFGGFDYHPLVRKIYQEWKDAPTEKPVLKTLR